MRLNFIRGYFETLQGSRRVASTYDEDPYSARYVRVRSKSIGSSCPISYELSKLDIGFFLVVDHSCRYVLFIQLNGEQHIVELQFQNFKINLNLNSSHINLCISRDF